MRRFSPRRLPRSGPSFRAFPFRMAAGLLLAGLVLGVAPAGSALAQGLIDEMAEQKPAEDARQLGNRTEIPIDELQPAWQGPEPKKAPDQIAPGIKIWTYSLLAPEVINIRLNAVTYVHFPEWETIEDFVWADHDNFVVEIPTDAMGRRLRDNVLLLRAVGNVVKADTSLHVTGRRHGDRRNIYTAMIAVQPKSLAVATDLTVLVRAARPASLGGAAQVVAGPPGDADAGGDGAADKTAGKAAAATGEAAEPAAHPAASKAIAATGRDPRRPDADAEAPQNDFLREIPFDYANMRFHSYEVRAKDKDSESIAPVRVMEDGYWTYIDFGADGRSDRILRPVVWRVIDGVDNQVNTRTVGPKGNILVAEGTGYNMTLRNGERVVCLIYKGPSVLPGSGRAHGADSGP